MRDLDKAKARHGQLPEFLTGATLENVQTEYEVLQLMRRCARHFDFDHFLVARFPEAERQRFAERLLVSNWSSELVRSYDELGIFHISRLVAEVAATKRPVRGDQRLLAPKDTARAGEDGAAELAARHGLVRSTAFLLHSTSGEPFIVLFSGQCEPLEINETAGLYFAAVQLFECLEPTFAPGPGSRETLSSRELECLRWAAAGKSSDEIAIILGISAYTVSSYFKTATKKLGAVNRMQAIASAMRLKLI
ncbi:DNA-binding CsgD family transcriptional regulator [Mycoplana sp. BE70]|uniref:helix-turn-helix transcriptional regulator n=1 Tax=Mycoplana sp. BE70 TaxID=2817775 RepID=UPI002855AB10|nr:LuxR C-terminal-related transcriptional regulator [Mycoplana sp. BE70]MDR6758919.1 DNA-binding CsgD family transcriptional regulator [Mycoplana sp. BE70]